jgi:RNA polymerase sigma-70 factor (ECF subfamily)
MDQREARNVVSMLDSLTEELGAPSRQVTFEAQALECVRSVAQRWPALHVDWEGFARHVASHVPRDERIPRTLSELYLPDLCLAFCCGSGDPVAVQAFEQAYERDFSMALGKLKDVAAHEELRQVVRQKLFVATRKRPKILEYSGRGRLRYWFRVTVVRTLLDALRGAVNDRTVFDEAKVLAIPSPEADPETEYLKRLYRHEFQVAFEAAVDSLDAEDRNILRGHYAHQMSIDQLSGAFGIHRATAARRLNKARSELLSRTRKGLEARLRVAPKELESIIRLIESQLNVSLQRLLGS